MHLLDYPIEEHLDYLTLCIFLSNTLLFPCIFILVRASVRQIFKNFMKKLLKMCNVTTKPGALLLHYVLWFIYIITAGGCQENTKEKIELKKI